MEIYSDVIALKTQKFYATLDESSQRRFVSLEAEKLGHGGKTYLKELLGCDYKTIKKGTEELDTDIEDIETERIRKTGGGRKSKTEDASINKIFLNVVSSHTAGSPMQEDIKWTYLNQEEIVEKMRLKEADVSRYVVRQLLPKHKYVKRKSQKKNLRSERKQK
jgi:hypothetical protein